MQTRATVGISINMKSAIPRWQIPIVKCPPIKRNLREKVLAEYRETTEAMKLKIPIK